MSKERASAAREAAARKESLSVDEQRAALEEAKRSTELPAIDEDLDTWSGGGEQREFTFKDPRQLELFGLPEGAVASEVEPGVARLEGTHDGRDVTMELPADMLAQAERSVALFDVAEAATKTYFSEGDPRDAMARQALEMLVRFVASKEQNVETGKNFVMEAAMKMGRMESVTEIDRFAKDLAMKGWVGHNVRPGETDKRGETGKLNQSLLELGYEREDVEDLGDEVGGDVDAFLAAEAKPARMAGLKKLFGAGMEIVKQLKSESAELIASAGKKAYLKGMETAGSLIALVANAALGKRMEKDLQFDLNLNLYGTESKDRDLETMEAELLAAFEEDDDDELSEQDIKDFEAADRPIKAVETESDLSPEDIAEMKAERDQLEAEEAHAAKDKEVFVARPGLGSRRTSQPASPYSARMGEPQAEARLGEQARAVEGAELSPEQQAEMASDQEVRDRYARFDTFMKDIDNLDLVKGNPELMELLKMKPDDRLQDQAIVDNTGPFGRLGKKYRGAKQRAAEFDRLMTVYENQVATGQGGQSPLGIREMPSGKILSDFGGGGTPQERKRPDIRGMESPEPAISPERAAEYFKNLRELQDFIRTDVQENPQFYGSDVGKEMLGVLAMTGQESVKKSRTLLGIAARRREMVENPKKFAGIKDKFEKMQSYIENELDVHPDGPFAGELAEANNLLNVSAEQYLIDQADDRKQLEVQNINRIIQRVQEYMSSAANVPEAESLEDESEQRAA